MESRSTLLSFPATMAGFSQAFAELRQALQQSGLDAASRYNVELVFEEVVANILRHGSPSGATVALRVELVAGPESVVLTFEDNGVPFDPRGRPPPVLPSALETGGLGLLLVKRAATRLDYQRTPDDRNRLVVTLSPPASRVAG